MASGNFDNMQKMGVATVSEIVNPLTLKLDDGRFIQLAGLHFPDLDFYDSGDLSVTANKILADFLKDKKIIIYQTKSKDHGRINRMSHHIAQIARADNNVWVQGMLLSLGLAQVRTTKYNPDMAKQMLDLENKARTNKFGLWDMDKYKILSPTQAQNHIGSYQIVEGKVNNASMYKNKLYLNFGNNWREDFTVAISAFDLRAFTRKKIEPQKWNGKHIRVRGWIKSYNGAYMEIDHPERFEALFEHEQDQSHEQVKKQAPANANNRQTKSPKKKHVYKTRKGSALPAVNE